jgi:OmpA-like transmembrane domain
MKKLMACLAATLGIAAALPAQAQFTTSAFYIGASIGRSVASNACALGPEPCDKKRDTAGAGFIGYDISRWLGVEAAYHAFGHISVGDVDTKSSASSLVAVLHVPLESRLSVYAKGGAYHGEMKNPFVVQRKNGGTFGLGVQYDAGRGAVRAEWQRFARMAGGAFPDTTNMDYYGIAILFRFR